jgi:hypothetical protein
MGAIGTLSCFLRVCSTLRFTQTRNHHPYNLALCGPLVRVRRLRVNVKRDPAVRVPQELLYGLNIFPIRFEQCAKAVTEGMPADSFVNTVRFRNRSDMPLDKVVRPIRLFPPHDLAGEDIIVIQLVGALATPAQQVFRHVAIKRNRLRGWLRFAITHYLVPDRTSHAEFERFKVHITPAKCQ